MPFVRVILYGLLLISVLLLFSYAESKNELTRKNDILHVFPGAVSSDGWVNSEAMLIRDVGENAIFQQFNKNNSSYLGEDPLNGGGSTIPSFGDLETIGSSSEPLPQVQGVSTSSDEGIESGLVPVADEMLDGSVEEVIELNPVVEESVVEEEVIEDVVSEEVPPSAEEETAFKKATSQVLVFVSSLTKYLPFVNESTTTPSVAAEEIMSLESDLDTVEISEEVSTTSDGLFAPISDEMIDTDSETVEVASSTPDIDFGSEIVPSATSSTSESSVIPTVVSEVAELQKTLSPITLSDFTIPKLNSGQFITNVQLRVSFAAQLEIASSSSPLPFVNVEYAFGDEWVSAGGILVEDETSNALNGGYFLFALPTLSDVSELEDLRVRLTYSGITEELKDMYLDAVWLEVDTETFDKTLLQDRLRPGFNDQVRGPKIHALLNDRLDFLRTESPAFTLKYNSQRNRAVRFFRDIFGQDLAVIRSLSFSHRDIGEITLNPEVDMTSDGLWTIRIPEEDREKLRPGLYTIELEIQEGGKVFTDSFDFQWGMLAVNPDQTEYEKGDVATISFGALTPGGNTVCDANLKLYIIDPEEFMYRVPVAPSGMCNGNNIIDVPDYSAEFTPVISGEYEMYVERVGDEGEVLSHTSDTFHVVPQHLVSVKRNGPTRIYPPALYPMEITVSADESFTGTLIERVPGNFTIADTDAELTRVGNDYQLVWDVTLMAGHSKTFSYSFDAPDLSPYLYTVGPARLEVENENVEIPLPSVIEEISTSTINSISTTTEESIEEIAPVTLVDFAEHRKWQIASDATGNMILFWNGSQGSVPGGWECISCAATNTIYQNFIMGSNDYNTATGSANHTPSASAAVEGTLTTPNVTDGAGTAVAIQGHTHASFAPTIGLANNLPSYRDLLVIQHVATAGQPETMPAGAIGIFDVASSSLPTGWFRFEEQDGYYVRGNSTSGNPSGSNTHGHTITGTTPAAGGTQYKAQGGGGTASGAAANHTHAISSSTATISNEPPYIEVLLGQISVSSSTTPPDLIALWTNNELPANWLDVSSAGAAPFNNRFIKASTTYGGTGGAATHTHADVNNVQTQNGAPVTHKVGSAGAASDHVHNVDVTAFTTETNLPPAKSAVFAKKQDSNPVYNQLSYQWFVNGVSSSTPTDAWPEGAVDLSEREPITATSTTVYDGQIIRLRISALVTNATATAGVDLKLQYAAGNTCSAIGTWNDVGSSTSSAIWVGYDNSGVTDHTEVVSNILSSSTVKGTYEENGYATSTLNDIGIDDVGEWDFVLKHNGAASSTNYCFRLAESDSSPFTTYTSYPKLLTNRAPDAPVLSKLFDNEKVATTVPKFEFTSTDPESDAITYQIQVDNLYDFSDPDIDKNSATPGVTFTNRIVGSNKDPFTSGQLIRYSSVVADGLTNGTTYYWRVRGRDPVNASLQPGGSNDWGDWSEIRSFTIDTSSAISAWFQTEDEQFDTNTLVNVSTGSDRATPSAAGSMTSTAIDFDDGTNGTAWGQFYFTESDSNAEIIYQVEYLTDASTWTLIPDADLSGNSSGFTATTSLLGLDTDTYNQIRLVATFSGITGSPYIDDWTVEWGYRIETPTQTKLFPNEKAGTTTPVFEFYTTDPQDDTLVYEFQYSTLYDFSASTTYLSSTSAQFSNVDDTGDTSPFRSGDTIRFTIPGGTPLVDDTTYWWRVRAADATSSNAFSFWTEPRSFTVATTTVVSTWYQITGEQFDTNILSGTFALTNGGVSVASTASEAMVVYGEDTDTEPRFKTWNGSVWSSEGTLGDIGSPLKWVVVKAGITREEYVAITMGTNGYIYAHVYSLGVWGTPELITNTSGNTNAKGFDLEYQSVSGDAMLVYCDAAPDPGYTLWDGTDWSVGGTVNLATGSNCEWIQLAANPTSDELIVLTRAVATSPYEAQVWDPDISNWATSTTLGSIVEAAHEGMAVEYEESGGQGIIVTSDGNPGRFAYNTWTGSSWSGAGTQAIGDDFEWGELARNVGGDELALCYVNDDPDVGTIRWNGSGWTGDNEHLTAANANAKTDPPFSCIYETTSGNEDNVLTVYSSTASTSYDIFTGSWAGGTQINTIEDTSTMQLVRTGVGLILGMFFDDVADSLFFASWDGGSWSSTDTIEDNASVNNSPYGKPYFMAPRNPGTEGTTVVSPGINFTDGVGPYWEQMYWTDTVPTDSEILYSLQYYNTASSSWYFIPNTDLPGNESGTTTSPIDLTLLDKDVYNLIRPYAVLTCSSLGDCPVINNWSVEWAGGITVSGTIDEFDQLTSVPTGTVAVAVNGTQQTGKTGTVSGGSWSIDNVTVFPGDVVTVYVQSPLQASEKAVGVTRYDGAGDITGMQLFENHVSLGSDDATSTPLTNADVGVFDESGSGGDVFMDLTGSTLTFCAVTGCGDAELYINASTTYQPEGLFYGHDIEIDGIFRPQGNTIRLSGSWNNNATVTAATSTIIFTATSSSETVDSTGSFVSAFNNVTFGSSTSVADWTLGSLLDVNGNLSVNQGTLARGTTSITLAGNLSTGANGSWSGTGTTTFDGSVSRTWTDAHVGAPENVGRVVINGTSKTVTLAGNVAAESIRIGADDVLVASSFNLTVYGNWVNLNAFTAQTGEVIFAATTTNNEITAGGDAFNDLTFNGAGGSWSFVESALTVNNNLTIATGTLTMPIGTTTLLGSFSSAGGTFMHSNGTVYFTSSGAETITASGTASTNLFRYMTFEGSGSWTFTDVDATSTSNVNLLQGTVTMPSGVFALGGTFNNPAGTFNHNSGTLKFTSGSAQNIDTNASFNNLLFTGSGSWTLTDTNVTALGDVTVTGGTLILPTGILTIGGSLTNTASLTHSSGEVRFSSADTGETISLGSSSLYDISFSNAAGGWTINQHATATNDVTLTSLFDFTLDSGQVLSVGGTFTNSVGGASTTWAGSILSLEAGSYSINASTTAGDGYGTLRVKANTDISMWNSSSTIYDIDATGSLYSQDHDSNDGDLYIFGEYTRTSGTEYWSSGTDFDGTDLTGSERGANVYLASGATVAMNDSTLEIIGSGAASTTIQNQGSGTYTISLTNGTTTMNYYDFDDLGLTGVSLLGAPVVTSLSDGTFEAGVDTGTTLTLSSTTIDANPAKQIFRVNFSTTTAISATNVTQQDEDPASYWWFRNSTGNLDGEVYDNDDNGAGGDPGSVRWDDSSLQITVEGTVYGTDEVTPLGAGIPVRVVVYSNGTTTYDDTTDGSGLYSIPNVTIIGDPVLSVFINGAGGGERAAVVTKTPTADILDLDLYQNRIITRHEDTEALTITDLAMYDSSDDPDLPYTAATGTTDTLSVEPDFELHIWATTTFTPGGTVTLNSGGTGNTYDGTLHIDNDAQFTAGGIATTSIGGSFFQDGGATYVPASSTVVMTATTSGKTIDTENGETINLYGLQFTGVGGGWNVDGNIAATGDIDVATGTVMGTGDVTLTNGSFYGDGLVSFGSPSTVVINRTNTLGGTQAWTFNDLTLGSGSVVGTTTPGSNATTSVNGVLTISNAHFLDAGSSVWNLGGTGSVFIETGTFLEGTSKVRYSGVGATNILSTTYYDLDLNALGGSPTYTAVGLGIAVLNDLTIGGEGTTTATFTTNDPVLDVDGDVYIYSKGTLIGSNSALFTVGGSWDNDGVYTASGGSITFNTAGTETIAAGSSSFASVVVNATGDITVNESATATVAFTLTAANDFTLGAGNALAVGGTFTNSLGGADTIWAAGSVLYLYGGGNYQINASTTNDVYENLTIGANTDIRMWNSNATTITVDGSGSLYSQDHNAVKGDLYIYGDYRKTTGADYWNYARDFDGTNLSGGDERIVDVYIANSASTTFTGGALSVVGALGFETTIQNQGAGTYALRVGGNASTTWRYFSVSDTNASGTVFSGIADVNDLSYGQFTVAGNNETGITIGGSVIAANPASIFTGTTFATSSGVTSAYNVTATGTTVSAWRFTGHSGDIDGEDFDIDPGDDPGYIAWDDSALAIIVSGTVYSDEGVGISGVCNGVTPSIRLVGIGFSATTTPCNGSGVYTFNGISYATGTTLTVYIDGQTENGVTVTQDPISNINNLDIYEDRVIVRHESNVPLSIADMTGWDSSDDPGDVLFTATDGSPDTLTVPSDTKLIVWENKEFRPNGNITLSNGGTEDYRGDLELQDSAIFTAQGTESHSIGGSFISGTGASFVDANSTVTFTTTGASRTIDTNSNSFYDLVFNGTGSWVVSDPVLSTTNNFTITQGAVTLPSGTTTVSGTFNNAGGSFDANDGLVIFDGTGAENITTGGSPFGTTTFTGSGSWTYLDANATTTGDFLIQSGTVTAPGGILSVGGNFINSSTFTHNSGTLRLTSASTTIAVTAGGSDLGSVTFDGLGSYSFTDTSVALTGTLSIEEGTTTLATGTMSIAGSFLNTGGTFEHGSGTILFNSGDTGETINPGGSSFYAVNFANATGGWTITENATATDNFSIVDISDFTVSSGVTLHVDGLFINLIGGSGTTWLGSTLRIDSGTGYTFSTTTAGGDQYDSLIIGPNTDLRSWGSAATTTTVDPTSSLYSQDHGGVSGELYIFGDYRRTTGSDCWSAALDFDCTTAVSRAATVRFADNATTTFTGGTLQIIGTASATSTITNQGSGTYALDMLGGTLNASGYAFRNLDAEGLNLAGTTTVTSLSNGDFELAVNGGSLITLSSTTLNQNASKVITGVRFATTSAITGTNVELVGTTPSAWTFTNHRGNLDGEAYDIDGGTDCGSVRWSDSDCLLTQQSAYRWRNDNGGEGVPNSEWFDLSWSKRKRVTLANADATTYPDAVIELNVTFDSDMQTDFDDLRFTDASGTTSLDYYIATTTPGIDANVWVKVPTLTASDNTLVYMYYGNGGASDASNGSSTFIAFDDFEDGDISEYSGDTIEFEVTANNAYERSYKMVASDPDFGQTESGGMYDNTNVVTRGEKIRYLQYINTSTGPADESCTTFATQNQTQNYAVCLELYQTDRMSLVKNAIDNDFSGTILASTTVTYSTGWYEVEVAWDTDDSMFVSLFKDDVLVATTSATDESSPYTTGGIGYTLWLYHGAWDLYTSRPLLATEPTVSFGFEQVNGGASWMAALNTAASGVEVGDVVRPRFVIENTGLQVTDQYQLEFAPKGAAPSCEAVSGASYTSVPPQASCGGSDICMQTSSNFTNRASTTDVLGGSGTFTYGQIVESPSNDTQSITVESNEYTEVEYAIEATSNVTDTNYCLRVTDAGVDDLDSYLSVAEFGVLFAPYFTVAELNGNEDIELIQGATTTIHATGTVSDLNGYADLDIATATIYRSGVGENCTADNNNCYISSGAQCSFYACSGNSCNIDCTADIYYFAEPTDAGVYAGQTWRLLLSVSDQGGSIGTGTAPSIDLQTTRSVSVNQNIDYGALYASSTSGSTNATTTIRNIGNIAVDISLYGADLTDGGSSIIPVNQQKFATSTFTYSSCVYCSALAAIPANLEVDLPKPTSTSTPITDDVYWGIRVPFGVAGTAHSGINGIAPIAD